MNRLGWPVCLAALVLGLAGFWLNTCGNQFPYYYHPDEAKKVEQVLTGQRNFNHPLLMLSASEFLWKMEGKPPQRQRVVELGRLITAAFCATGSVAFFLAAWFWRGALAAAVAGLLTMHHQVFELAHYMKEDPALYLGVGLTCLALIWYLQKPHAWAAFAIGATAGVAGSGKYLGILILVPVLIVVWKRGGVKSSIVLFAGFVLLFGLINWPIFSQLATFQQSFGKEMNWAVSGQKELTRSVPHSIYLNVFVSNTTPIIWILLAGIFYEMWTKRKAVQPYAWYLLGTLGGWLILLSFSPKTNDRYFLPLTGLTYLLAGGGAAWAWVHWKKPLVILLLAAGTVWEGRETWQTWQAFGRDDRAELTRWIQTNIPASETIAYDARVNLPDDEVYDDLPEVLPHRLLRETFVSEMGSEVDLRQKGVRYVVISESTYGRFFLDSLRPKAGQSVEYERSAAFYRELKRREPRWSSPRGKVLYLHPGLEVYDLQN